MIIDVEEVVQPKEIAPASEPVTYAKPKPVVAAPQQGAGDVIST